MAYEPMYHALPMVNACEIFWAFLVLLYFSLVFYILGPFWDVFLKNKQKTKQLFHLFQAGWI